MQSLYYKSHCCSSFAHLALSVTLLKTDMIQNYCPSKVTLGIKSEHPTSDTQSITYARLDHEVVVQTKDEPINKKFL